MGQKGHYEPIMIGNCAYSPCGLPVHETETYEKEGNKIYHIKCHILMAREQRTDQTKKSLDSKLEEVKHE